MDEIALRADAEPERAEVAEHDLALRRLAEDAHVRDAAVAREVARAGGVAAVLRALGIAVLRLLDLTAHRSDHAVAPQSHARIAEGPQRLDVARERPLHVRDAEAIEAAVLDEGRRLEAGDTREPRLAPRVGGVHVPVEHQARPASRALPDSEHVGAPVLDLLPLHAQSHLEERVAHQLGHRLLVAGEARRRRSRGSPIPRGDRGR